jgi:hypothetical protein
MKRITLAAYSVRVRVPYSREYEKLSSFGDDQDLFDFLWQQVNALSKTVSNDKEAKHVLEAEELSTADRRIGGILNSGEYGIETLIRDVNTWNIALKKKKHHAEMLPFYFLFDIPENRDLGFLLLQRTGVYGIRHILSASLDKSFQKSHAEYRLAINPVVPEGAIEQYVGTNATMMEIRFIRHSLSSDITGALGKGKQSKGTMELAVRLKDADRFPFRGNIRNYIDGKRKLQNLIELEEVRFPYDNVKIKMRVDGKETLVDLGHPERLRAAFDVTEKITYSPAGHPLPESISEVAHGIMDDLMTAKYGEV